MDNTSWMQRIGATPGRLVLIAILAVVLAGAILVQVRGEGAVEQPARPRPAPRRPAAAPTKAPVVVPAKVTWPKTTLEAAAAYDPFARPAMLATTPSVRNADRAAQLERTQRALATLRSREVQMVLSAGGQRIAIIGGRTVRVGDVLDGLRVVAIGSHGLTVEESPSAPR